MQDRTACGVNSTCQTEAGQTPFTPHENGVASYSIRIQYSSEGLRAALVIEVVKKFDVTFWSIKTPTYASVLI